MKASERSAKDISFLGLNTAGRKFSAIIGQHKCEKATQWTLPSYVSCKIYVIIAADTLSSLIRSTAQISSRHNPPDQLSVISGYLPSNIDIINLIAVHEHT